MDLIIEPLKEEELDEYIRIYWEAFEPLSVNLILPMIYTHGLQPDMIARFKHRFLLQTNYDISSQCYCARDVTTGTITGVSRWIQVPNPPRTALETARRFTTAHEAFLAEPPVAGCRSDLDNLSFRASFHAEVETCQGQPHITLQLLAIDPRFHRRGIGTMLLKQGLRRADEMGLPVYVAAGQNARALYERFGFEVTGSYGLDCREYGGRSSGEHCCMIRPAGGGGSAQVE